MTTRTINFSTDTHRAQLDGDRVTISYYEICHGWIWAGSGVWRSGRIDDCAADLGDDVYALLDAGLAAAAAPSREAFIDLFDSAAEAMEFETAALSVDDQFLPGFARAVKGGEQGGPDYWAWLIGQVEAA